MDEITIGDKLYVSSKRAAQITGYAKDYIGQLCREGRVEARLVGRNWYVLDSALREHRFGKVAEEAVTKIEEKTPESPISTWKRPEYVPETPVFVPNLAPKPEKNQDLQIGTPAIADMQSAWKEWFQEKNEVVEENKEEERVSQEVHITRKDAAEPEIEKTYAPEPEVQDVALNRIEDPEDTDIEEEVEIHREYRATASLTQIQPNLGTDNHYQPQIPEFNESKSGRSAVAVQIALILLSLTALGVAIVGTGHAERLFGGTSIDLGFQKSIIDYLGGKSEYKSSL